MAAELAAAAAQQMRHRRITCVCGAFLKEIDAILGQRQQIQDRRCSGCRHWPVLLIREDGMYNVLLWPERLPAETLLNWPAQGWR